MMKGKPTSVMTGRNHAGKKKIVGPLPFTVSVGKPIDGNNQNLNRCKSHNRGRESLGFFERNRYGNQVDSWH